MEFELNLSQVTEARGQGDWSLADGKNDCKLQFLVKVEPAKLTTSLTVVNTGTSTFSFQALLHTYYLVQNRSALDPHSCYIKGLEGYTVNDKITSGKYVHGSDAVIIQSLTDRVYGPPSAIRSGEVCVELGLGPGHRLHLTARSEVNNRTVPTSCVVWNPHVEKAKEMADFGDDQYVDMICVEPGMLDTEQNTLQPNQSATLMQVLAIST
jgi:glucose-6-phosphate 1-epimerase